MRKLTAWGMLILIIMSSCKKDDSPDPVITPDYTPMAVGNYWVYEYIDIDSAGNETAANRYDSIVIVKDDSIINGKTYYIFFKYNPDPPYSSQPVGALRDSAGYLVNWRGDRVFSATDFSDTLYSDIIPGNNDTFATRYSAMSAVNGDVILKAGSFSDVLQVTWNINFHVTIPGTPNPRQGNARYAPGVGLISDRNFFASSPAYFERRLIRYGINE